MRRFYFGGVAVVVMIIFSPACKQNRPPNKPLLTGERIGLVGETLQFTVVTTDPDGDNVSYLFIWGDTSHIEWSPNYVSGQPVVRKHVYYDSGVYVVKAKARDEKELESEWSDSIILSLGTAPPSNLRIIAETDSTVRLTWNASFEGLPDHYRVYFRDVAASTYSFIDTTTYCYFVHNPHGATGDYKVSAVFGTIEHFSSNSVTTIPVHTGLTVIYELNAGGNAGYGWNRMTGEGSTYSMGQTSNSPYVDFYVTDFAPGHPHFPYYVASPDMGPSDPGGTVPLGPWRVNGISDPLANEFAPLPPHSLINYFNYTEIGTLPCLLGCYTHDGYYALIKVVGMDSIYHTITVKTWFQLVQGLRLIKH